MHQHQIVLIAWKNIDEALEREEKVLQWKSDCMMWMEGKAAASHNPREMKELNFPTAWKLHFLCFVTWAFKAKGEAHNLIDEELIDCTKWSVFVRTLTALQGGHEKAVLLWPFQINKKCWKCQKSGSFDWLNSSLLRVNSSQWYHVPATKIDWLLLGTFELWNVS